MNLDELLAMLAGFLMVIVIGIVVWYILQVIAYWRIFRKAGEPGWKSIIPFYNLYIQYKISWSGGWFFLFLACSIAGAVLNEFTGSAYIIAIIVSVIGVCIAIYESYRLSRAFGHGVPFAIGILFLSPIFIMILGFGSSEYQEP